MRLWIGWVAGAACALAPMVAAAQVAPDAVTARTMGSWLRYAIPPDPPRYHELPHAVVLLGDGAGGPPSIEEEQAYDELDRGLGHMVAGTDVLLHRFDPRLDALVVGTTETMRRARLQRSLPEWTAAALPEDGFRMTHVRRGARQWWVLQAGSPRAEVYAAFRFGALVAADQQLPEEFAESPRVGLRAVDLGADAAELLPLLQRRPETGPSVLARLLASVQVNGLVVGGSAEDAAPVAAAVRPFGVELWWKVGAVEGLPAALMAVPNLGGVVLDAGGGLTVDELRRQVGEANSLARQLKKRGGRVILRGALGPALVDAETAGWVRPEDRAAVLRGALEPNVVVSGEMVSELAPLAGLGSANFGLLPGVAQAAEAALLPAGTRMPAWPVAAWERALATPERGAHEDTTLLGVLAAGGGGVIGVLRPGELETMLRQPLLLANLYGFGRVAVAPTKPAEAIAEEWARQAWGDDARVFGVAAHLVTTSGAGFAAESEPFGLPELGWVGVPDPARAARAHGTGKAAVADGGGFGTDRTAAGTGEIGRYPAGFAAELGDAARVPGEWLLLLHRVPFAHGMTGGKTAVQAVYDGAYAAGSVATNDVDAWDGTRELVDPERFAAVRGLLADAARRSEIWRESATEWLLRVSRVPDALGFVGNHSGRVEAEATHLLGFGVERTEEPEDASGGAVAVCRSAPCRATTVFRGEANVYRVEVGYFDAGVAAMELVVNGTVEGRWRSAAGTAAAPRDGSAERFVVNGVRLKPGDQVEVRAVPLDAGARVLLDFVEITRDPRWN